MNEFISALMGYNENYNAELLERAYRRAELQHRGQKRRSGEDYIIHPQAVAIILANLGMDDKSIAAGLLHDVVEDTEYSLADCRKEFGPEIAMLVDGVTKLTSLVYESREDRQAENIRKMFLAMSKDIRILIIKLSDRLHNMRTIEFQSPEKRIEKCRETLDIYAPLAARLGIYAFKFEMEDISFKNLYPEEYSELDAQMQARKSKRAEIVEDVIAQLNDALGGLGIKYEIYGRNKHYYSIYKKMQFQEKGIDEIFDLNAVRVIVESVKDCYGVLGTVHTMWTPIPGRFKDYIAMPKSNRYQSLHTTLIGKNGVPFEIQIRTHEMHIVAEYGIAAHWKYKEGVQSNDEEVKLAWVRQILESQQDENDPQAFVESLKMDLFSNQVFVFTPKGDVMELPAGSTPLDFAFKIHTDIGSKCVGAKVNGKMVPIDYNLQNGEIVDIVTSATSKGPSIDWLKIVKTSGAKNKIRQYLKRENRSESAERGRHLLEKTARRKGWDLQTMLKQSYVLKASKALKYDSMEDLYNAVSYGGAVLNRTLQLCEDYYHEERQAELKRKEKEEARLLDRTKKRRNIGSAGVTVKGVENLLIHFAKCCSPVPGDEIIGFITRGKGVSVHRKDCFNMLTLKEEHIARLIEVEWEAKTDQTYDAVVSILVEDRKGLLAEMSRECEQMDININGINLKTNSDGTGNVSMVLAILNLADVEKIMARLRTIEGVIDVYRGNN
ncbi:MAG TPA: bifunctional (p)ppGpp synthetase/guanosine-3',5'-bis(diphosphate) 3'-pyrophosphohydrolase [Bacillota bacterium]|nr:bifunctional (p)ppGpp synthetase/guanosine-3',5'-bis(diphosphate) 3'-pyrophosphohydrolase [Bacillota bacterium]